MEKHLKNTSNIVLSLQKQRFDRPSLVAFVVRPTSKPGVFSLYDNLSTRKTLPAKRYGELVLTMVKTTQEIDERALINFFGRRCNSDDELFRKLEEDHALADYVASYIDRRIAKCVDLAVQAQIPIYCRKGYSSQVFPSDLLHIVPEAAQARFYFDLTPNELRYHVGIEHNDTNIAIDLNDSEVLTNKPCLLRNGRDVFRVNEVDGKKLALFTQKKYVRVPENAIKKYLETFVISTIRQYPVVAKGFDIVNHTKGGNLVLRFEDRLAGGKCLVPSFIYSNKTYACNQPNHPEVTMRNNDGRICFLKSVRDVQWERQQLTQMVERLGLKRIGESEYLPASVDPHLVDNVNDVVEWINKQSNRLLADGVILLQDESSSMYYTKSVSINVVAEGQADWFDLYGMVTLGDIQIPFINLKKHILHDIREYKLPNGQIFVLPEAWFARFRNIFQFGRDGNNQRLKIPKSLVNILIDSEIDAPEAVQLEQKIREIRNQKVDLPTQLNANLRGYQKVGYAWLWLLGRNGINGCLADDMGLGKTLQTIALLQKCLEVGETEPSLIVVPTSLISNWEQEIQRFAPNLKTMIYAGGNREALFDQIPHNNLIITSYGVLRNDVEKLRAVQFHYLILDESQNIKNPASKTYRAAILMNAAHHLSLSGTPIENSLLDLWAQMNFLNPGMLGSLRYFRNEFQVPIEKFNNDALKKRLKRMVDPLIMRRTKELVASDLPPVIEQVVRCRMSEAQADVYEREKSAIRRNILSNIEADGIEKSAIHILSGLTRLRQIANHPAMLPEYAALDSGKFDEITRSLTNVIAEGHKILIFSSFVKHLEQVKTFVEAQGIDYEMLTGASRNRAQIVENFQHNTQKKVFLISLKAGGVGLNLTAADYVFVLDPWWNPAAEMQATARAHRIGQDKNVFVYRFISHNTVEEKIINLQERKEALAQLFVESTNPMKYMDKDLVMELLN